MLIEQLIAGRELTCAILGRGAAAEALPLIEIRAPGANYDYHSKYFSDETQYLCPAPVEAAAATQISQLCLRAYRALGARGWGRVDVMLRDDGAPFLLELNTSPGMTGHSLVPMAARESRHELRGPRAADPRRWPRSTHRGSRHERGPADECHCSLAASAGCGAARRWPLRAGLRSVRPSNSDGIEVRGDLQHVTAASVRAAIAGRLKGNYFTMRLDDTRRLLETVPWVAQASVRRVWPDRLLITLSEHRALGAWADGRLLSDRGELFVANVAEAEVFGPLPSFDGPASEARQMAAPILRICGCDGARSHSASTASMCPNAAPGR